jgi:hypothetical protein
MLNSCSFQGGHAQIVEALLKRFAEINTKGNILKNSYSHVLPAIFKNGEKKETES